MYRKSQKSSSKSHAKSSAEAQQAFREPRWPPRSFLFGINELQVNEDPSRGGVVPRHDEDGRWVPPIYSSGFYQQETGRLYRWHEGTISLASSCPWIDGAFRVSDDNSRHLEGYKTSTLFWCNNFTQFKMATCDVTTFNMAGAVAPYNRWLPLTFQNEGTLSRLEASADECLASRGTKWIGELGLASYESDMLPSRVDGGLAGDLATIVGLVAFSCEPKRLYDILQGDRAWHNYQWRGHDKSHGRVRQRGVVVNIYYDPLNPQGSTENTLRALEWSEHALLQ
jgi:hypothetical protein